MKRLAVFLVGALVFFELAYAIEDRRMFFGTSEPAPQSGVSDRPQVEAALTRLDAALVGFYADGGEAPLRALVVEPDGPGSPLHEWRLDRHAWERSGGVPALALTQRRLLSVSVAGLDVVSATTEETWSHSLDGGAASGPALLLRYRFRRAPAGLLVDSVEVTP